MRSSILSDEQASQVRKHVDDLCSMVGQGEAAEVVFAQETVVVIPPNGENFLVSDIPEDMVFSAVCQLGILGGVRTITDLRQQITIPARDGVPELTLEFWYSEDGATYYCLRPNVEVEFGSPAASAAAA